MSKSILVTGGAGFVGSHIVDRLIEDGHDVTILDNLDPQVHKAIPAYINRKAKFIEADIRNIAQHKQLLKDVEVIFHEAAAVGVGQSMYEINHYVDVNTMGTARLLHLLANEEHNIKKLLIASSMSIYGEGKYTCPKCGIVYPKLRKEGQLKARQWEVQCPGCGSSLSPVPTDESKPLLPTSIYAITKRDQEEMALATGVAYGIPTIALRYFNIYGPRQSLSNPYTGICAIFSSRIKNNNSPIIYEDGCQTRDFVNVRDIVNANMLALNTSAMDYEMFNVGTGRPTSVIEIADTLIKLYGSDLKSDVVNGFRAGDIRHCYSDISKISKYGFQPTVKLEDGLRELVEWGRSTESVDMVDQAQKILMDKKLVVR